MDTDDYVSVPEVSEKDSVAIINPEGLDQNDLDQQLQDLPLADDCMLSTLVHPRIDPSND